MLFTKKFFPIILHKVASTTITAVSLVSNSIVIDKARAESIMQFWSKYKIYTNSYIPQIKLNIHRFACNTSRVPYVTQHSHKANPLSAGPQVLSCCYILPRDVYFSKYYVFIIPNFLKFYDISLNHSKLNQRIYFT